MEFYITFVLNNDVKIGRALWRSCSAGAELKSQLQTKTPLGLLLNKRKEIQNFIDHARHRRIK